MSALVIVLVNPSKNVNLKFCISVKARKRVNYESICFLDLFMSLKPFLSEFLLLRDVRKRCDSKDDRGSVTNLSGAITKKPSQMKNCCNV